MKKLVSGLAGIVLSCISCLNIGGCVVSQDLIYKEAMSVRNYSNKIKKIIEDTNILIDPNDSIQIYDRGDRYPVQVIIRGKKEVISVSYYDIDGDGIYEKTTLRIPNKLYMKIFPKNPQKIEPRKKMDL